MKDRPGIEEKPENINNYLMDEEVPSHPNYFLEQENNDDNNYDDENMLSKLLSRLINIKDELLQDYNL